MSPAHQFVMAVTLLHWRMSDHKPPWGRVLSAEETRRLVAKTFAEALKPKDGEPAP